MGIGQRFPVVLMQISVMIDTDGRNIETIGQSFKTWAEITQPSNFRQYADGQTQMGKTKRFLIRFKFDKYPNADWKLQYAGQKWTVSEIQKVNERQFYWQFTATNKSDV